MSKRVKLRRASGMVVAGAALAVGASAAAAAPGSAHWVMDPRTGCYVYDPDILPADTAAWSGDCAARRASGGGTVVFSAGNRFVETISGTFAGGLATGAVRINRADGSHFEGSAVSGRIVEQGALATTADPPKNTATPQQADATNIQQTSTALSPSAPGPRWLDEAIGHSFVSADGSVLVLSAADGGPTRRIATSNGASQLVYFRLLNGNQGTVTLSANAKSIDGVFHLNDSGLAVDYADGRSESLSTYSANALLSSFSGPGEQRLCTVWYPEGHQFSAEERQAALDEYARRLGLGKASSQACGTPTAESASTAKPAPSPTKQTRSDHKHADNVPTLPMLADATRAEPILVRSSDVHLIDAQAADSDVGPQTVSLPWRAIPQAKANNGAGACLNLAKENGGLGFRNSCAYDVQFAYCAASTAEASCENSALPASAHANTFAPVLADADFGDREFHLRWIACAGKSGDVMPRLVHSTPPEGQCIKAKPKGPVLALKAPDAGTALSLPR